MTRIVRQSLLAQLLGGYLLFVAILIAGGLALNSLVQLQLFSSVQAADRVLATTLKS